MAGAVGYRRETLRAFVVSLSLLAGSAPAPADLPRGDPTAPLRTYQTEYYVIHSDLDIDTVREAAVRLTAMAEEYQRRTRGFRGTIRKRLPFHLFTNPSDYHAAGGPRGTCGLYKGRSLMAVMGPAGDGRVWNTIQHEGFHQFADVVIGGNWPVWVSEGLAEYFDHAIWTGDNFVTGVIPPGRLQRVKAIIKTNQLRPFLEMLTMDRTEWNAGIEQRNYDQAWSMVHFLVHANGRKYQEAFSQFINDIAARRPWKLAFVRRFGRDVRAFQDSYARWWMSLGENPTEDKYVLAVVQTLTSFFARAFSQQQKFSSFEEYFHAVREGKLKVPPEQWLPPKLLTAAIERAPGCGLWWVGGASNLPRLVLRRDDGTTFTGTFTLRGGCVTGVEVRVSYPEGRAPRPAVATRPG